MDQDNAEIYVSSQVTREAYIAVQHHYGVSKSAARAALVSVFTSGLIAPLNGQPALKASRSQGERD